MKSSKYVKHDITILYVEDEESIRKEIGKYLHLIASTVFVAKDGLEGLEFFKNNHIDLIVTDINMPQLNGIEMLTKIRELDSSIFAIILSGHDKEEFYGDLAKLDVLNDYLSKPCSLQTLFNAIDKNIKKILDRKEYKHTLSLLHQYKTALDVSAIVSKTDLNGKITYANDKFCEISGYSKEELLGSDHNIIKHPDVPAEIFEDLWATIKSNNIWKGKLKNLTKTGEPYYMDTTIIPIVDSNGVVIEYLATRFDITELYNTIEREKKLQKVKSTFLANMSHEIRTPLNGIIGFLDLLKKSKLDSKQEEFVSVIKNSSHVLLSIINDILDFSKMEAEQLEIENIEFNLKEECKVSTQLFHLKAEERGIHFIVEIDDEIPDCVVSDPLRLRQIITNLINNAMKFTSEGQVLLRLSLIEKNESDATLNVLVKDSGIGISQEKQKMIFEPFSQTDISTTRKYGGTGLGLSISKQLIELLCSKLIVKSEKGVGSEFSFDLKLAVCNKKCIRNAENKVNFKFKGQVLVAEDNKVNQMLMSHILEAKGINYKIEQNGLAVFEEYQQNSDSYDIILMDINMPIMDGLEATKKILEYEENNNLPHVPIVALTANAIKGDKEKFLSVGMDGYLSKPINKEELFATIAKFSYFILDEKKENETILRDEKTQYDIEAVALELELPTGFLKQLLDTFFDTIESEIGELHKVIEAQDYKQIYELSHSIKGSSGNLKLNSVFEKAKEIEQYAKDEDDKVNYLILVMELNVLIENYKKVLI